MPFLVLVIGLLSFPQDDKTSHFIAGATLAKAGEAANMTPLQRCALSMGAGLAKEAWDATGRGHVEFLDLAATTVGCGLTIRF